MSVLVPDIFSAVCLVIVVTLGRTTRRKGHFGGCFLGFMLPLGRLIGAVISPTLRAADAMAVCGAWR
jgi:hypothetical protein